MFQQAPVPAPGGLGQPPEALQAAQKGGSCLLSERPRGAVQLSKAAPAAALFYCTVAASTCQACTYSAAEVAATMSVGLAWAALAGVMVTNKQFSDAAEFLLRRSLFEHARARGIMTETLLPNGWEWSFSAILGVAVVVAAALGVLEWQACPAAEAIAEAVHGWWAQNVEPAQAATM
ncbi:hypothetical protein C2E20_1084 [Micractinium conductrix]|uniref:Uncharacterized protein n=1 Tax=Micractinium conductrix TaxID=554055 RepID=A0A2P6VP96_9CHLO|nr:hypothetical protein C2E20_1084 [Micractinium conductrix]|eukprot:PSC75887.1 hypothetical protein C2E20_1084 [Micractinium conductrix]